MLYQLSYTRPFQMLNCGIRIADSNLRVFQSRNPHSEIQIRTWCRG